MRRALFAGCLWLAATATASPELAGGAVDPGAALGSLQAAQVGEWVTFAADGDGRRSFWRLAVVGGEPGPSGRESLWMELEVGEEPKLRAPLAQLRFLVERNAGLSPASISRMFVAFGYERPQELSPEALARVAPPRAEVARTGAIPSEVRVHDRGETRVATVAGPLEARKVEVLVRGVVVQRLWLSRLVPVLPIARIELPSLRHRLEVVDFGRGGSSRMVLPPAGAPKIWVERYDGAVSGGPHRE